MDSPGYVVLSRLALQPRATELLAHNIANADTPGFRAHRMVFAAHLDRQRGTAAPPGGARVAYVEDRASWRDTTAGALQHTANPLDVAIAGDGFFAVETPRGERYTRAGRFSLDIDRRVVDMEGHPVLDVEGRPIVIAAADARIEVLGDGTLRSENGVIARLRVVRFDDPQRLRAEGDRLFAADDPPLPVERPALVQGAVEGSNVRPVIELTRLMAELREFQFAAQFVEREGERLSSAVERILRRRGAV
jgi:flagellar basal-body rod protein FlgF